MTKDQATRKLKGFLNKLRYVLITMLGVALGAGWIFSLVEPHSFGTGVYWSFITMLGVGYGDIYPVSSVGRVLAVTIAAKGLLVLIPFVVGKVILNFLENQGEFDHDEQEQVKRDTAQVAQTLPLIDMKISDTLFLINELQKSIDTLDLRSKK